METIIITVIFFVLSIIITILITRYYSFRSNFNIILSSIVDLVRISFLAKDKVKILYNDKEVKSLSVIRMIFENEGNIDVSEEQVKKAPSLKFLNDVKIISIDEINATDKSNISFDIISENEIHFNINFLGRKSRNAFQILVHKDNDFSTTHKDLSFDEGIIKNTNIKFIDYESDKIPSLIFKIAFFLQSKPIIINLLYSFMSGFLFITGLLHLIYIIFGYNLFQYLGIKLPETITIWSVIGLWFMSFTVIAPLFWFNKRLRYRTIFRNSFKKAL